MNYLKCLSLNCFLTQYAIAFVSLLLLVNLSCCLGSLVSFVAQLLMVSSFAWCLTKKYRNSKNRDNFVTSFKRAVVVTGCDSGFGHMLAHKLNEHGFRVYATVLDTEGSGAKDLVSGARFEDKTKVLRMDVTNDEEVKSVYEQIKKDLEKNGEELWALVNNAGIVTFGPLDWGTIDTYKKVFEVNTFGTVRVTRTFLPLIRQSKGRVVNVVSMAGRMTANNMSVYSMSKHALISFSDALRRENKKFGIYVSTIEPMAYKTAMASDEYFVREVEKNWTESTDDVKQVYGEEFPKKLIELKAKSSVTLTPSGKLHEVIDNLVDAIRNPEPQVRYPCVSGCKSKLIFSLMQNVPVEILDLMVERKYNLITPLSLRNEE